MGTLTAISFAVLGVLGAVLVALLADEARAWSPSLTDKIISLAVRRAPEKYRERLDEEWRSHVQDVPGRLSKLFLAWGFVWAAQNITAPAAQEAVQIETEGPSDIEFLVEMARTIEPAYLNNRNLTGPNASPALCPARKDGRHDVPGAALYFSQVYGRRTFHGPCTKCHQWIDTGEMDD